ncbi:MAG TPA: acyl-CoA dehydrogenase family protein [Thermoanaerobaculia bacterium]|jgi:alkylation response protein AidB-like acyl-CoA dehydrogenase
MDFTLSPGQQELQQRTARFCAAHLTPAAAEALDRTTEFPAPLYAAMAAAGLLRLAIPVPLGGEGGDLFDVVLVTEELAKHSGTAVNLYLVNAVFAGALLLLAGSDEQRRTLVPRLGAGECKLAFAMTEPGAGSDAAAISTTAVADGDDFLVQGTKLYTTGASVADFILTVVRTRPEEKASRGTTLLLVARQSPGLEILPMEKIAGNAFASCEVRYHGVRVPAAGILGGPQALHRGWEPLMLNAGTERLCVAASCLGLAQAAYGEAREHALRREQFGQPIVGFQAIQHALVEMATEIEALRWLTYHAAWLAARNESCAVEIGMAKLVGAEELNALILRAMKILGGKAYLKSSPLQRFQREALLSYFAGGTSEIQKNLIGRLLGLVPGR